MKTQGSINDRPISLTSYIINDVYIDPYTLGIFVFLLSWDFLNTSFNDLISMSEEIAKIRNTNTDEVYKSLRILIINKYLLIEKTSVDVDIRLFNNPTEFNFYKQNSNKK